MPIFPDGIENYKIVPCRLGYKIFSITSCISPFAQMIYFRLYFCFESLFSFYLIIFLREGEANGSAYEV